jgi:hypothetical protein
MPADIFGWRAEVLGIDFLFAVSSPRPSAGFQFDNKNVPITAKNAQQHG